MKIFVSAAEISSDIHAEKILKSLWEICQKKGLQVEWKGIGGPRVRSLPGFDSLESAENLRTMGFIEVLKKAPYFKSLLQKLAGEISRFDPDLLITFDYPDFHLKLVEKVTKENLAPRALKICGIPPKVWVWRSGRVEKIRKWFHGVWVIFPFEESFYRTRGIPVIYRGNPLIEELFQQVHQHEKDPLETLVVMPGSRDSEINLHSPLISEALELFSRRIGKKIRAQVPVPNGVRLDLLKDHFRDHPRIEYEFYPEGSGECLSRASYGLIKSGTSTLESTILGCIPVIFYRMNPISEWIFRGLVKGLSGYLGPVGLPNILLGVKKREDSFFPELLGPEATPEALSENLYRIYSDFSYRQTLANKTLEIRKLFQLNEPAQKTASEKSAEEILKWIRHHPEPSPVFPKPSGFWIRAVSLTWSSLNWVRRRLYRMGLGSSYALSTPSILVGNLQAGGSGKTPLVIALAKELVARGKKVAVVSRGYGRTSDDPWGDEPREILREVPQVILSVHTDRVKAARDAEKQNPDWIIFDDGFQNLKFKAGINLIAVTDRSRSEVPYRDFDSEIRFADLVIATKGTNFRDSFLKDRSKFYRIEWNWDEKTEQPVWLLCGIADPKELVSFYLERGLQIKKVISRGDHAVFDPDEVQMLIQEAKKEGCMLAVTEKDAVKFPTLRKDVFVLRRSIRNRDWIEALFKSKL